MLEIQLLTIEEFGSRFGVSRSTVFDWMNRGRLVAGVHYIQLGSTVRFPWGKDLIGALLAASDRPTREVSPVKPPRPPAPVKLRRGYGVNLDYR